MQARWSSSAAWAPVLVAASLPMLGAGCLQPDPDHCANWGPERRCDAAAVCSRCTAEHNGCVPPPVSIACLVALDATSSNPPQDDTTSEMPSTASSVTSVSGTSSESSTSSSTTETETSAEPTSSAAESSGDPPECAAEGLDPLCPSERPFCLEGRCAPCTEDPALACPDARCHPSGGSCVQCLDEGDCLETEGCRDDYTCGPCTRHEHCPASACDLDRNLCIDPDNVVDVEDCTTSGGPPYCTIADALAANSGRSVLVIRLAANVRSSAYVERIELVARTLAILGRGNATIDGSNDRSDPAIELSNTARLYLADVRLRSAPAGVTCTGSARLYLDRVRIDDIAGVAIEANACAHLQIRESRILSNDGSAIIANAGSHVVLHSSIIGCNGSTTASTRALQLNDSTFDIRSSTIAANRAAPLAFEFPAPANLECISSTGIIRNSVLLAPDGRSLACPDATFAGTLLDDETYADPSEDVVSTVWNPDWFEDLDPLCDLRLADGVRQPFADLATWELGDPRYDLEGPSRTPTPTPYPGQRLFAGAHQP